MVHYERQMRFGRPDNGQPDGQFAIVPMYPTGPGRVSRRKSIAGRPTVDSRSFRAPKRIDAAGYVCAVGAPC